MPMKHFIMINLVTILCLLALTSCSSNKPIALNLESHDKYAEIICDDKGNHEILIGLNHSARIIQVDDKRISGGFSGFMSGYSGQKRVQINPGMHNIYIQFHHMNKEAILKYSYEFIEGYTYQLKFNVDNDTINSWLESSTGNKVIGKGI